MYQLFTIKLHYFFWFLLLALQCRNKRAKVLVLPVHCELKDLRAFTISHRVVILPCAVLLPQPHQLCRSSGIRLCHSGSVSKGQAKPCSTYLIVFAGLSLFLEKFSKEVGAIDVFFQLPRVVTGRPILPLYEVLDRAVCLLLH